MAGGRGGSPAHSIAEIREGVYQVRSKEGRDRVMQIG
jgi:hypothetical protein